MIKRRDRFARFAEEGHICLTNNVGRVSPALAGSDRGAVMPTLLMTKLHDIA